ncbi:MAG: hypothetical protein MAG795_00357 [Candidatus Woesearchaeota archaeon]|nr:hypothetical protein [Candidatus Woesearchaeota archaeon]
MLDKTNMKNLQEYIENYDSDREKIIKKSRDVLKLSKLLINSVHRQDMDKAEEYKKEIEQKYNEVKSMAQNELGSIGAFRVAAQEYVEAIGYYCYVLNKDIPNHKSLNVSPKHYLSGLCDIPGEVIRKTVNDITEGKTDSVFDAKKFISELYDELLKFDFRRSYLRKGFDRVRHNLSKIEELSLKVVMKNEGRKH